MSGKPDVILFLVLTIVSGPHSVVYTGVVYFYLTETRRDDYPFFRKRTSYRRMFTVSDKLDEIILMV